MISGLFEIMMLLCFAAAWPLSICRSLVSKTSKGKSLTFLIILIIGYIMGILNKFASNDVNYVLIFYIINIMLVSTDTVLWFRNNHLDKKRDAKKMQLE